MCGIVGLFLKDKSLEDQLGRHMAVMLNEMSFRGPDSAGFAVYGNAEQGIVKVTVRSDDGSLIFDSLVKELHSNVSDAVKIDINEDHAIIAIPSDELTRAKDLIEATPSCVIVGSGQSMEVFKGVGLPTEVADKFDLPSKSGTHGIGHTRMATESSVTIDGSHPFSTGLDQCLVHNGSLSNHNRLRRTLRRKGFSFQTENDSEVAAGYLTWRMSEGASLGEALEASLDDLDGFFTFVVGTHDGFGVLRDEVACKPAVLAETDQYVAFASEYRALTELPAIETAKVWEPEPATVYFWEH